MRYIFLWIAGLISLSSLSAQQISARLDLGRRDAKPQFYEYSPEDGGLITLGPASIVSSRFLSLTKYSSDLKKEWSVQVIEQNGRKNVDFVTVIGPNILVFVSEFIPKDNIIRTSYYAYDLGGKRITDNEVLSVYPNQKEQKTDLQYVLSPNKRRLLCYKNLQSRRESEQILYYLFDENGSYLTNGEIRMKYPDSRFRIRSLRVSNEGNIFILGKFFKNTVVRESDDFQYMVYRQDIYSGQGREILIELGDRYLNDLAFRLDRQENLYVAGFYSNRGTDQIGGTVLQKISPEGELLQNSVAPFESQFLSNYLSSSQIERGRELRNFYMDPEDGIVLRSDGGVLLVAEKFYITYQTYRDIYGFWVDREIYHYDDIILTSVASDGRIEWNAIIEKLQQSDNPAHLSYFQVTSGQGAYLMYEYKPRRLGLNVYYNLVDLSGQVAEVRPLLRDYRYGNAFFPRYCTQINNEEAFVVYTQGRGKVFSVAKVRFGS